MCWRLWLTAPHTTFDALDKYSRIWLPEKYSCCFDVVLLSLWLLAIYAYIHLELCRTFQQFSSLIYYLIVPDFRFVTSVVDMNLLYYSLVYYLYLLNKHTETGKIYSAKASVQHCILSSYGNSSLWTAVNSQWVKLISAMAMGVVPIWTTGRQLTSQNMWKK